MNAPKLVESIPTVTAPVQIPEAEAEPRTSRARYLAGVVTGGVLFVLGVVLLGIGMVVS